MRIISAAWRQRNVLLVGVVIGALLGGGSVVKAANEPAFRLTNGTNVALLSGTAVKITGVVGC